MKGRGAMGEAGVQVASLAKPLSPWSPQGSRRSCPEPSARVLCGILEGSEGRRQGVGP